MIHVKKKCNFSIDSSAKTPNEEPGATAAPATLPTVMALSPDGAAGSVEGAPNPREIIRVARGLINETTVRQNGCLYLFQLDGENGGLFYLDLKNGKLILIVMYRKALCLKQKPFFLKFRINTLMIFSES